MNHNMQGKRWGTAFGPLVILAAWMLVPGVLATAQLNAASVAGPAANLLRNPGFEEGEITPSGWNKGQSVDGMEYLWTTGVACEGRACVCLSKKEKRFFPIAEWNQEIAHNGMAMKLAVKGMVKAQDVTKAIVDVKYRNEAGEEGHKWAAYIGAKNPSDPPITHDWKEYGGEVEIPAGTKTIVVALQIYGPGVVAFDNVSAVAVEPSAGVGTSSGAPVSSGAVGVVAPVVAEAPLVPGAGLALVNASFETGGQQPDGWQQGMAIPGVEFVWAKGIAHTGSASLGFRKSVERYFPIARWYQTVPRSGKAANLRMSAWVKCERVTKAILDVEFVHPNGDVTHEWAAYIGAKNTNDPPVTHDWKQYTGVVTIPPDARQLNIGLQIYGPGAVWFDDVEVSYVQSN